MNKDTWLMLNKADSFRIVYAKKIGRFVFQAFSTPDLMTHEPELIGGGELSVLSEWFTLLNKSNTLEVKK